jgi:hypothetical protein
VCVRKGHQKYCARHHRYTGTLGCRKNRTCRGCWREWGRKERERKKDEEGKRDEKGKKEGEGKKDEERDLAKRGH